MVVTELICDKVDDKYSFGFNGQIKTNEWAGLGNHYTFKEREYDPRTGRFISVDPLAKTYPWNAPYNFAEDRPIDGRDLEGKEWENFMSKFKKPGELHIKVPNAATAQQQHYSATVENSKRTFQQISNDFKSFPNIALSNSKATFHAPVDGEGKPTQFKVGSYIKIDINGPMNNGYVKVVGMQEKPGFTSATFATMEGHIEKGLINFSITDKGNSKVEFDINSTSEVDQGAAKLPGLKNIARGEQKKSWNEVLDNAVKYTGGQEETDKRQTTITDPPKKN